jgi:hypothetical protein
MFVVVRMESADAAAVVAATAADIIVDQKFQEYYEVMVRVLQQTTVQMVESTTTNISMNPFPLSW